MATFASNSTYTQTTSWTTQIWGAWVDEENYCAKTYGTTAGTTNNAYTIWQVWSTTADTGRSNAITIDYAEMTRPRVATAEEVEAQERQRQLALEDARVRNEARLLANAKAKALLRTLLDAGQRKQLDEHRYFDVIAGKSKRCYRIHSNTHGNVRLMEGEREVMSYCAQPHGVPVEDSMLAQKLQLEHDEEGFLKVANARRLVA